MTYFLKRNSQIHVHKQQPLATEYKNAHNEYELHNHFYCFQEIIKEHSIQLSDLYNMNETGFYIDCGKAHTVLSMKSKKKLIFIDVVNRYVLTLKKKMRYVFISLIYRNYITLIECIGATGHCFSFFFIIQSVWVFNK